MANEASAKSLEDFDWRPEFVQGAAGSGEVNSYVRFESDGRINGFGGCNRFFGRYTASTATAPATSGDLRIGPLASTRKACKADIMEHEAALIAALEAVRGYSRNATYLTLSDQHGTTVVRLRH